MRFARLNLQLILILSAISQLMTGCMVGPNFHAQPAPKVDSYTASKMPKQTVQANKTNVGKSQRFMIGADIPADWWHLYHSRQLNDLIERGLANSPTLASAQAALRQADEALAAQIGNLLFPAVNGVFSGQRQQFAGSTLNNDFPSSIFNLFNATVNVTYTLDVFGGSRRQIEAARAAVNYQQYELIASYLTLTSNIATTAVAVSAFNEKIIATKALVKAQRDQLAIIRQQFNLGGASEETVLSQQTLVEQTAATIPVYEQNLARAQHALAVLVGELPSTKLPIIKLSDFNLPKNIPVTVPSNLVNQRPDVQASSALLHYASAEIGVATANLLPQFSLSGAYGWSGGVPSSLFESINKTWNFGATLSQPFFHGGALLAARRQAIAAYDQAFASYKQTVLQAFANVADSLRAIENDAKQFKALDLAEKAARKNVKLTRAQYQLGGVDYLTLLTAEQQYQETVIARIQAQAARYNDTTALFQALGGGWWNRKTGFCDLGRNVAPEKCG